jgi:hypothetical protein
VSFYAFPLRVDHRAFTNPDISYTPAPWYIRLYRGTDELHSSFWGLASLGFPEPRAEALKARPLPSPEHKVTLEPNDQLLCFDYMYYVGALNVCRLSFCLPFAEPC